MKQKGPDGKPIVAQAPANQWAELIGAVGVDIAEPLTSALEQMSSLVSGGRVDGIRLRKLRATIEEARQVGKSAQQLSRFMARRIRILHERVQLDAMLRDVLRQRAAEAEAHGLQLPDPEVAEIRAAEVLADASLLFCLLNTLIDWTLRHAQGPVQFSVDIKTWPEHARLICGFDARHWQEEPDHSTSEVFDSLTWRLFEQIAETMDLNVRHEMNESQVELGIEFPRTANASLPGVSSIELGDDSTWAPDSMPLVGSHVLVIASRRALRLQIRNAIHHLGMVVDLVSSVDEAFDFCREGLPQAIIFEEILGGEQLVQLRSDLRTESPDLAFVEIVEEGDVFEMSDETSGHVARVGRPAIETALPSVLLFELSRAE